MAAIFPLIFVFILWVIKLIEISSGSDFSHFGVYPLQFSGLKGIITAPLVHGDWKHLFNNTFPLLGLGWAIYYFYKEVAHRVFILIYLMSGFWLWFFAREAYHIGASGLIYGFGAFVFLSGIIRRNRNLLAISLLVSFLYGSMVWGIFPLQERISWESHLLGMVAGIILAVYYKNEGPPLPQSLQNKANINTSDHLSNEEGEETPDIATLGYLEYERKRNEKNNQQDQAGKDKEIP